MYATVLAHLAAGVLLPWVAGAGLFDSYHPTFLG
jgi:hypothetical protein